MGGSPGVLGPKRFESVVLPHLQALTSALPGPVVLSACGNTNGSMHLLAASGAEALSVDQTNDLAKSRQEGCTVVRESRPGEDHRARYNGRNNGSSCEHRP